MLLSLMISFLMSFVPLRLILKTSFFLMFHADAFLFSFSLTADDKIGHHSLHSPFGDTLLHEEIQVRVNLCQVLMFLLVTLRHLFT